MGRSTKILTWAPNAKSRGNGGRWKKTIDGKVWFFGHGKNRRDTESYLQALEKYEAFKEQMQIKTPVSIPLHQAKVTDVAEKYVQNFESRYQRGEITASHFTKTATFIQRFVDAVDGERMFSTVKELDLNEFRIHCLTQPPTHEKSPSRGKPMSLSSVREQLFAVRGMYQWAMELNLCDMPRNMKSFVKVKLPKPKVKTYTVDEVRTMWAEASERLRCYMALALNCGYGAKDISDLCYAEIDWEGGRIQRERSKTGVFSDHKLWPLTLELLKKYKLADAKPEDRLFLAESSGLPLVHEIAIDGKGRRLDAIKCMFWRVQEKTGIKDGRGFYCLRKTAATEIERINPLVTELFLAHAEKGMKKHYARRSFEMLDGVTDELAQVFNLQKRQNEQWSLFGEGNDSRPHGRGSMRMTKKKKVKYWLLAMFKEYAAGTTSDELEIEATNLCRCCDDPNNEYFDSDDPEFNLCDWCKVSRSTKCMAIKELGGWMEIEPHPQAWWKTYEFYFIYRSTLEALLQPREWELVC